MKIRDKTDKKGEKFTPKFKPKNISQMKRISKIDFPNASIFAFSLKKDK